MCRGRVRQQRRRRGRQPGRDPAPPRPRFARVVAALPAPAPGPAAGGGRAGPHAPRAARGSVPVTAAAIRAALGDQDEVTIALLAAITPVFAVVTGFDLETRVVVFPQDHPTLGWSMCVIPGCGKNRTLATGLCASWPRQGGSARACRPWRSTSRSRSSSSGPSESSSARCRAASARRRAGKAASPRPRSAAAQPAHPPGRVHHPPGREAAPLGRPVPRGIVHPRSGPAAEPTACSTTADGGKPATPTPPWTSSGGSGRRRRLPREPGQPGRPSAARRRRGSLRAAGARPGRASKRPRYTSGLTATCCAAQGPHPSPTWP